MQRHEIVSCSLLYKNRPINWPPEGETRKKLVCLPMKWSSSKIKFIGNYDRYVYIIFVWVFLRNIFMPSSVRILRVTHVIWGDSSFEYLEAKFSRICLQSVPRGQTSPFRPLSEYLNSIWNIFSYSAWRLFETFKTFQFNKFWKVWILRRWRVKIWKKNIAKKIFETFKIGKIYKDIIIL